MEDDLGRREVKKGQGHEVDDLEKREIVLSRFISYTQKYRQHRVACSVQGCFTVSFCSI